MRTALAVWRWLTMMFSSGHTVRNADSSCARGASSSSAIRAVMFTGAAWVRPAHRERRPGSSVGAVCPKFSELRIQTH